MPVTIEYRQRYVSSGIRILWKDSPGADHANRETAYTIIPQANLHLPTDLDPPTTPQNASVHFLTPTRAQIAWDPSIDDVEVLTYRVYRNNRLLGETDIEVSDIDAPYFVDDSADANRDYVYRVQAVDWLGKTSGLSNPAATWERPHLLTGDSIVSPAWVEGTCAPGTTAATVRVDNGAPFDAIRLGDTRWGVHNHDGTALGVTLNPDKAVRVEATFTSRRDRTATVRRDVRWTPTVVCPDPAQTVILRTGDSLLLTAARANRNTPLAVDVLDDGTAEHVGTHRLAVQFDEPGTYPLALLQAGPNERVQANIATLQQLIQQYRCVPWIRVILQNILRTYQREATTRPENLVATGTRLGSMTVRVIGVDLDGPIASEVGYRREKGVAVFPLSEADTPVFESADVQMLEVDVIPDDQLSAAVLANPQYNPANYGKRLWLKPTRRGMPMLLGRLPNNFADATADPSTANVNRQGTPIPTPLLAYQEIDEYTVETAMKTAILVNDSTSIGSGKIVIRPHVENLIINLDMFSSRSTFGGGVTQLAASTASPTSPGSSQTTSYRVERDQETGELLGVFLFDIEIPEGETSYCFRSWVSVKDSVIQGMRTAIALYPNHYPDGTVLIMSTPAENGLPSQNSDSEVGNVQELQVSKKNASNGDLVRIKVDPIYLAVSDSTKKSLTVEVLESKLHNDQRNKAAPITGAEIEKGSMGKKLPDSTWTEVMIETNMPGTHLLKSVHAQNAEVGFYSLTLKSVHGEVTFPDVIVVCAYSVFMNISCHSDTPPKSNRREISENGKKIEYDIIAYSLDAFNEKISETIVDIQTSTNSEATDNDPPVLITIRINSHGESDHIQFNNDSATINKNNAKGIFSKFASDPTNIKIGHIEIVTCTRGPNPDQRALEIFRSNNDNCVYNLDSYVEFIKAFGAAKKADGDYDASRRELLQIIKDAAQASSISGTFGTIPSMGMMGRKRLSYHSDEYEALLSEACNWVEEEATKKWAELWFSRQSALVLSSTPATPHNVNNARRGDSINWTFSTSGGLSSYSSRQQLAGRNRLQHSGQMRNQEYRMTFTQIPAVATAEISVTLTPDRSKLRDAHLLEAWNSLPREKRNQMTNASLTIQANIK